MIVSERCRGFLRERVLALENANLVPAFFCLGAVAANQSLFRLGAMSPGWALGLAVTVASVVFMAPHVRLQGERGPGWPRLWSVVIGLSLLVPLFMSFALSANREFPFSGDAYFHMGQSYRMAYWWLSPVASAVAKLPTIDDVRHLLDRPWVILWSRTSAMIAVVAVAGLANRRNRVGALVFATIALIGWGLLEQTIFLRYPGGGYLLRLPLLGPAFLFNDLELSGRLANICAAIAWLFILRPWLFGRWPDLRVLPIAAFLLWQKDFIYYFHSSYLEPWSVVFCLIAVETVVERGREGAPAACLWLGLAAAIKEPFVLAIPFVWLAGWPWRGSLQHVMRVTGAAIAAGVPFVLYYVARTNVGGDDLGPDRVIRLTIPYDQVSAYLALYADQMKLAFPGTGAVLALGTLALIPLLLWRGSRDRLSLGGLVAAGICIAVFFLMDEVSASVIGYYRYLLHSLPFLVAGMFVLGEILKPRQLAVAAVVVLALQAPSAWTAITLAAGPDTDRNFIEQYDAPLVFPIKSIVSEAERKGFLSRNAPVLASRADAMMRPLPGSNVDYGPFGELYCECTAQHPNVLALFIRYVNSPRVFDGVPYSQVQATPDTRVGMWNLNREQRPACLAQIKKTCGHVLERLDGGELVAILGAQVRAVPGEVQSKP